MEPMVSGFWINLNLRQVQQVAFDEAGIVVEDSGLVCESSNLGTLSFFII